MTANPIKLLNVVVLTVDLVDSMDAIQSIFIGVISGVLASMLLFLVASYVNKVVLPWYRSLIYQGLDISGEWNEEFNIGDSVVNASILLDQKAHDISGQIVFSKITRNQDQDITKTMTYNLTGTFFEGYLAATARNINRKRKGIATYLLQVEVDGSKMSGQASWVATGNKEIQSGHTTWKRGLNKVQNFF